MKASLFGVLSLPVVMAGVGLLALSSGQGRLWAGPQGAPEGANSADKIVWREWIHFSHDHPVHALACSSDLTVAADEGGNAFVWSTKSGKDREVLIKGNQNSRVDRLQFTADGKDLYQVFDGHKGLMRHPVKDKKIVGGYGIGGGDELRFFGVSGDGETWLEFLNGGRTLLLRPNIYSANQGNVKPFESVDFKRKVIHAIMSADRKWLAVATDEGTLHILSRDTLRETQTIVSGKERVAITDIQFSPDGQRIAVSRDDAMAKVYDTTRGEEIATFKGHTGIVFAIAFSPDGKTVVTGGDDNAARIWDASTGKELATLKGHTDSVRCVAFDPSGEILVTGSADKRVRVWRGK